MGPQAAPNADVLRASVETSLGSSPATDGDDGRGFLTLDGVLRRPDASGLVFVHGAAGILDAVAAHAGRRARAAGRAVITVGRGPTDDAIRDSVRDPPKNLVRHPTG